MNIQQQKNLWQILITNEFFRIGTDYKSFTFSFLNGFYFMYRTIFVFLCLISLFYVT